MEVVCLKKLGMWATKGWKIKWRTILTIIFREGLVPFSKTTLNCKLYHLKSLSFDQKNQLAHLQSRPSTGNIWCTRKKEKKKTMSKTAQDCRTARILNQIRNQNSRNRSPLFSDMLYGQMLKEEAMLQCYTLHTICSTPTVSKSKMTFCCLQDVIFPEFNHLVLFLCSIVNKTLFYVITKYFKRVPNSPKKLLWWNNWYWLTHLEQHLYHKFSWIWRLHPPTHLLFLDRTKDKLMRFGTLRLRIFSGCHYSPTSHPSFFISTFLFAFCPFSSAHFIINVSHNHCIRYKLFSCIYIWSARSVIVFWFFH